MKIINALVFNGFGENSEVTFKNPLPVTLNFNFDKIIGKATLKVDNGNVYAEIETNGDFDLYLTSKMSIYPYTSGVNEPDLYEISNVSLGPYPNLDETIPPIKPNQIIL